MALMTDAHNLQRFVEAQNPVYPRVLRELRNGQKESHWMWFIFPQLRGLGHSHMANVYGIASRLEAEAYLAHPILGARLKECTQIVNQIEGRSIEEIFGSPDDMKFRSSMTLFARAATDNKIFQDALRKYFAGQPDPLTLQQL